MRLIGFAPIAIAWVVAAPAAVFGGASSHAPGVLIAGRQALEQWYASEGERVASPSGRALRALARLSSPGSLFVTAIETGPEPRLSGFKLRPGRATMLRPVLENLGFAVRDFQTAADGPCDRFELSVRPRQGFSEPITVSAQAALAIVAQDDTLCQTDRALESPHLTSVVRRGSTPSGLTLRLRDVDLEMVLRALRVFTSVSFIVDGDVSGRFDIEWTDVTLEEALESLVQQSGLSFEGPLARASEETSAEVATGRSTSPRFRVSSTGRPWASVRFEGYEPFPVSVEVRGDVADFLRLVSDVTGIAFVPPEGPLGEATVLGTDCDPGEILANLLDSEGLLLSWDDPHHATLTRDPARAVRASAATPPHPTALGWRLRARHDDYARCRCLPALNVALDVELAGVGRLAGPWQALFFSFKGVELPRGDPSELDYEVGATDGDGVTLKTKNGATLRLPLAPLR